jgi:hypothetical protein
MSCFTACKRTQKWREVATFGKILRHFSPIVPPSAAVFASVALDAGGLLWRKLECSKSLVLLQVGGLMCRWQWHSVKPSCWECSTTVQQAQTQLRVVVPIEEEEGHTMLFRTKFNMDHLHMKWWKWITNEVYNCNANGLSSTKWEEINS